MDTTAPTLFRPARKTTIQKYAAIQARWKVIYDVERKRYDDCIAIIMREFYITSENTVMRILRTEVPDDAPAEK
jgi:hypothetical protein